MKGKRILSCLLAGLMLCSGCAAKREQAQQMLQQQKEKDRYESMTLAMDTVINMTVYHEQGDEILLEAEQEIQRLENLFSVTKEDSDISRLNANAGKEETQLSEETFSLLQTSKEISAQTGGCFDITISPVVKLWGFMEEEHYVPSQTEIDQAMALVNEDLLQLDASAFSAFLEEEGMAVDLGAIAKGYASAVVAELLREKGVASAMISLGGNLACIGTKPDGSLWEAALANPLDETDYVGLFQVQDCFLITSGGYQRYFEQDGKRYHHIIDPDTGYPAESGLLSVTILSQDGTKADALSTALFVMGLDKAIDFWRSSSDFEAVFITEDGRVIATEGAAEAFTFEGRDNDFTYEVVNR